MPKEVTILLKPVLDKEALDAAADDIKSAIKPKNDTERLKSFLFDAIEAELSMSKTLGGHVDLNGIAETAKVILKISRSKGEVVLSKEQVGQIEKSLVQSMV